MVPRFLTPARRGKHLSVRKVSINYAARHLLFDILVWTFDHGCKCRSPTSRCPLEASSRKPSWYMPHCRAFRKFVPMNYSIKTTHMQEQCRQETHSAQLQAKIATAPHQPEQQRDHPFPWPRTREICGELSHQQFYHRQKHRSKGRGMWAYPLYLK